MRIGFDKKIIFIMLGLAFLVKLMSGDTSGILSTLYIIPGVLLAMTVHEFAHAYTAYKLGDDTPKLQNRVNLNPLSHIEPMGLMFLLVAGFGWGKPVEIDPRNFKGKKSIEKAEAIVASAGPISNFILAFILMIVMYLLVHLLNIGTISASNVFLIIIQIIQSAIIINIGLGVFNLIPLPPLDGSKVLFAFLPDKTKYWFIKNQQVFYLIFLVLFITGASIYIVNPVFAFVFNALDWVVSGVFSLFV